MIEVDDLNVVFGRGRDAVHAVRQVSFRVAEGESFWIGRRVRLGQVHGAARAMWASILIGVGASRSTARPLTPKRDKAFSRRETQ